MPPTASITANWNPDKDIERDMVLNLTGLILSILSVITGLWHQQTVGWDEDKTLLTISFVFAFTHCAFYLWRIWKHPHDKVNQSNQEVAS